jgi:glutathione peroxidase
VTNPITQIPFKRVNGNDSTLAEYAGKVLLVVNVASKCGLTKQYEGLEKLNQTYKAQGLQILGFPANNFMGQEPGSDDEIQDFCKTNYDVTFPVMSKISVVGDDQHPLYAALTEAQPKANNNGDNTLINKLTGLGQVLKNSNDVLWNFEKFLINREGHVVARFAPNVAPEDSALIETIQAELKKESVPVL